MGPHALREPRLAQEALRDALARERAGAQVLDGDRLVELEVLRRDDDSEPALTYQSVDEVFVGDLHAGAEAWMVRRALGDWLAGICRRAGGLDVPGNNAFGRIVFSGPPLGSYGLSVFHPLNLRMRNLARSWKAP